MTENKSNLGVPNTFLSFWNFHKNSMSHVHIVLLWKQKYYFFRNLCFQIPYSMVKNSKDKIFSEKIKILKIHRRWAKFLEFKVIQISMYFCRFKIDAQFKMADEMYREVAYL